MANVQGTLKVLGASNHTETEREADNWYATDEIAVDKLLEKEKSYFIGKSILEPCCGSLNISNRLKQLLGDDFGSITNIDMVNRGYEDIVGDYLKEDCQNKYDIIITNPPYSRDDTTINIILKAINDVKEDGQVYMFVKTLFLESQKRYDKLFSKLPPRNIYVFSNRVNCYRSNDRSYKDSAVSYCWMCWEKGYIGDTILDWIRY